MTNKLPMISESIYSKGFSSICLSSDDYFMSVQLLGNMPNYGLIKVVVIIIKMFIFKILCCQFNCMFVESYSTYHTSV